MTDERSRLKKEPATDENIYRLVYEPSYTAGSSKNALQVNLLNEETDLTSRLLFMVHPFQVL